MEMELLQRLSNAQEQQLLSWFYEESCCIGIVPNRFYIQKKPMLAMQPINMNALPLLPRKYPSTKLIEHIKFLIPLVLVESK
jgi:hypothetical protein